MSIYDAGKAKATATLTAPSGTKTVSRQIVVTGRLTLPYAEAPAGSPAGASCCPGAGSAGRWPLMYWLAFA